MLSSHSKLTVHFIMLGKTNEIAFPYNFLIKKFPVVFFFLFLDEFFSKKPQLVYDFIIYIIFLNVHYLLAHHRYMAAAYLRWLI